MELKRLEERRSKRNFMAFRSELYFGDDAYVCTDNFVVEDILFLNTEFAKRCVVRPVAVIDGERMLAQAILMYHDRLPYVQIAFFDALEGVRAAVDMIIDEARRMKEEFGACGIIAGLCGHISYGVGILTDGFEIKNSFDSIYNKSYYKSYFDGHRAAGLSTYKNDFDAAFARLPIPEIRGITVRCCNLKKYEEEMELMRQLCDRTIGKTDLYFPTESGHFYELTKTLKPFLRPEDLLFAEDAKGDTVGFLFTHPDFNQMLKGGREYSLLGIGAAFVLNKKKIDTVKINAIGSTSIRATYALIRKFADNARGKYKYVETNFIWDNNRKSADIAEMLLGDAHRRYEVYYIDES